MKTVGYIIMRLDEDSGNWKPFTVQGNNLFWYSKTAAEFAIVQQNEGTFKLAAVRL